MRTPFSTPSRSSSLPAAIAGDRDASTDVVIRVAVAGAPLDVEASGPFRQEGAACLFVRIVA